MKKIGEQLKDIRLQNNLTQKEFAKLFYLTESAISNYEKGVRVPNFEFIKNVCEKFNLSLDFFMNDNLEESEFTNLIVISKNGKQAIFDQSKSVYLTQYLYDRIILSKSGNHIVVIDKEYRDIKGDMHKKIIYSAVVNNMGKVSEFSDLEFGNYGYFYKDVCPAYSKTTKKIHLVTNEGKILSKGYTNIRPVSTEMRFGLYYGINYSKEKDEIILNIKLLNNKGEELNYKFDTDNIKEFDLENVFPFEIKEFNNLSFLIESMKKESIELIKFAPRNILERSENYYKIMNAIIEDCLDLSDEEKRLKIHFLIGVFTNAIDIYSPYPHEIIPYDFMPNLNFKNKIIESTEKRMLENFYSNKLHFQSDLQVINNIGNIKNLKVIGNYIWEKDGKFYFGNKFFHAMFRNKNIDKGDINENLFLEFEKYVLNFCEVCSSIENKPSIMIFNNFTDHNEITKKSGESYYNIEDTEEINLLNKKPSIYVHSDLDKIEDNELIKNIIEERSNTIPLNDLFIFVCGLEKSNITDIDLFLRVARSRRIYFVLFLEESENHPFYKKCSENVLDLIKNYVNINYICNRSFVEEIIVKGIDGRESVLQIN